MEGKRKMLVAAADVLGAFYLLLCLFIDLVLGLQLPANYYRGMIVLLMAQLCLIALLCSHNDLKQAVRQHVVAAISFTLSIGATYHLPSPDVHSI